MKKHHILLADDHRFLIDGIQSVLETDAAFGLVGYALHGREVLQMVATHQPDLILMDLNMPGMDGLQTLKELRASGNHTKVVILSSYSQHDLVNEVKKAGGNGYLVKNCSADELKATLHLVLNGNDCFPENDVLSNDNGSSVFVEPFLKKYQLTRRETEIIKLLCNGLTTKEIAAALYLSELTINTHRKNLMRKLEVKNVVGLIHFAREHQLL